MYALLKISKMTFKNKKNKNKYTLSLPFFVLCACGGGANNQNMINPLGITFVSPENTYGSSNSGQEINAYWLDALIEKQHQEGGFLNVINQSQGSFKYSFPQSQPSYLNNQNDINGWGPVSNKVQLASSQIFTNLDSLLNISFEEVSNPNSISVIAIMANEQSDTAGYGYNPIDIYLPDANFIFSDVFIAKDYLAPMISGSVRNFDNELLIHEIGHAIGLRHPYENYSGDGTLLSIQEENNKWTAMSYEMKEQYFNGEFRLFDKAALIHLYGINPTLNPNNDTYYFMNQSGTIIMDGAGTDTVSAEQWSIHAYIDLRENAHSYLGTKSSLITDPFQLSVGKSDIENALGGNGNDWIVGNNKNNLLKGGKGNDVLFGGEGQDIIIGGQGVDTIDLTETIFQKDTIICEDDIVYNGLDVIYNFHQGLSGDSITINDFFPSGLVEKIFTKGEINQFNISNQICRVTGFEDLTSGQLQNELSVGTFSNFEINENTSSLFISAENNSQGNDQKMIFAEKNSESLILTEIAVFKGEGMDIDHWTLNNFI